ncbi:MAG: lysylphosphatidylglycerol synthase transmembrane domain-containing protein [Desulfocapsaceae bacterium]|nr:lysylphosphatidylglycerol synthase transmembrane domain-containing protein [Desulfocapsaceae bacterium]
MNEEQRSLSDMFCRQSFWLMMIRKGWRWLAGLLAILLAYFALRDAPWSEVRQLVSGLGGEAVLAIGLLNLLMLPLMTARWWLILRLFKAPVSLVVASLYKCSSNAASYLTPGPHFGGEPLLVYFLRQHHGLTISTATTSVILDRLLETLASIVILALCLFFLLSNNVVVFGGWHDILLIMAVLTLIGWVLIAFFSGRMPLSHLITLAQRIGWRLFRWRSSQRGSVLIGIEQSEKLAESLFRDRPGNLLTVNAISITHWLAIFAEFWIMAAFLGVELSFVQLCAVVVVARLAYYTPLPAGIGVLELALPHVTTVLGLGGTFGIGLCLIIRFRDLVFSLVGLGITLKYLSVSQKSRTPKFRVS